MDPDEAERRAKHMREQRDRLIAAKKAEREKKVRAEEEAKAKISADSEIPDAVLRAQAQAQKEVISRQQRILFTRCARLPFFVFLSDAVRSRCHSHSHVYITTITASFNAMIASMD